MEGHLLKREADAIQWGVHVRNQNGVWADGALTTLDHSQGVGEYLERRKETLKALFHQVLLNTRVQQVPRKLPELSSHVN